MSSFVLNAIINCHLYSGRIGRPGMGPFSVTGQPDAMGGRAARPSAASSWWFPTARPRRTPRGTLTSGFPRSPGAACFRGAAIENCLFVAAGPDLPPRDWLIGLFARPELMPRERLRVLAGSPASAQDDAGELVCSCFEVGRHAICRVVERLGPSTPEAIGGH